MFLDQGFLMVAVAIFVASHYLMSHPFRTALVNAFGTNGFRIVYSLVSVAELLVVFLAYHFAPHGQPFWSAGNLLLQTGADIIGYFAVVLFVAALSDNPGLVGGSLNGLSTRLPTGVYRVTRHPMMFAIAIWSTVHIVLIPTPRNIVSCVPIVVLALVGASLQDAKLIALTGREWRQWAERTPFWPDLSQIGAIGLPWITALPLWLLATWVDTRAAAVPTGLWYLIPDLPY